MLHTDNRLRKDKDFRRLFSSSRPFFAGHLSLRSGKNSLNKTRFGFVISNKIDKRSTRRNSLKRRLRVIARELILTIKPGYDVIVVVRENFTYPYNLVEIKTDFIRGMKGLGLIDGSKDSHKNN